MPQRSGAYHNLSLSQLLAPLLRTASATSASFDCRPSNSVAVAVSVGATGDTLNGTNRMELQVQESDDNSTFTAVADADLVKAVPGQAAGTFGLVNNTTTAVNTIYKTAYIGKRRYVRVAVVNYGTTGSGTTYGVTAIGTRPTIAPVNT